VHHIRPLLFSDEVAFSVLGQAGIYLGQDLGVLAPVVELLQLRTQAGALGRGGGRIDIKLNSPDKKVRLPLSFSLASVL
jgi:hypothetical protein